VELTSDGFTVESPEFTFTADDRAESCSAGPEGLPWKRYADRSGVWQVELIVGLSLVAIVSAPLACFWLLRRPRRRSPRVAKVLGALSLAITAVVIANLVPVARPGWPRRTDTAVKRSRLQRNSSQSRYDSVSSHVAIGRGRRRQSDIALLGSTFVATLPRREGHRSQYIHSSGRCPPAGRLG
jgi:hypothetical protein